MKLTWFGGTTLRLHIGGQIFVTDAALAPAGIDAVELVSGADRVVSLATPDAALVEIDAAEWRPRRVARRIDADAAAPEIRVYRIGETALLIDAVDEPPTCLMVGGGVPRFSRWADGGVVVLSGTSDEIVALGRALLAAARPKLLALSADEAAIEAAMAALVPHLDGAGLVSLEPGMALEA